jgi:hypothetical protein
MRKTTKTITEVIHEHGVISFELPLYERLLEIANADGVRDQHIDMIYEKTIKISEDAEGDPLTIEDFPLIVAGIPTKPEENETQST